MVIMYKNNPNHSYNEHFASLKVEFSDTPSHGQTKNKIDQPLEPLIRPNNVRQPKP